jgi:hypothetical protein
MRTAPYSGSRHVERQKLTMRRFTRLTNAFSRKVGPEKPGFDLRHGVAMAEITISMPDDLMIELARWLTTSARLKLTSFARGRTAAAFSANLSGGTALRSEARPVCHPRRHVEP